uniref:Uncharacterized protein n=1 Tax=Anopheles arabiensis TaxID=7173 RepID=A0A8W7MTE8_ANOAR
MARNPLLKFPAEGSENTNTHTHTHTHTHTDHRSLHAVNHKRCSIELKGTRKWCEIFNSHPSVRWESVLGRGKKRKVSSSLESSFSHFQYAKRVAIAMFVAKQRHEKSPASRRKHKSNQWFIINFSPASARTNTHTHMDLSTRFRLLWE